MMCRSEIILIEAAQPDSIPFEAGFARTHESADGVVVGDCGVCCSDDGSSSGRIRRECLS